MGDHAEDAINEEMDAENYDPDARYCEMRGHDCPTPGHCSFNGCKAEEEDYLDPDFFDEEDDA